MREPVLRDPSGPSYCISHFAANTSRLRSMWSPAYPEGRREWHDALASEYARHPQNAEIPMAPNTASSMRNTAVRPPEKRR